MAEKSKPHGKFVWYDVMTTDTKAAEKFYSAVLGWTIKDSGMPDRSYALLSVGGANVGGLMPIPEDVRDKGVPPMWMGYIGVSDVDDYAKRVSAAGGTIRRGPEDIPGVGRFAVAADPDGAGFMLFKGNGEPDPAPVAKMTPGHVGWRELHAGNGEAAFAFYSGLFGWTKVNAVDMGENGVYQTFAADGDEVGGMMTKMKEMPYANWLYYFNVDSVEAGMERVKANGGKVMMGPMQVPGDFWIASCADPQGAMFALISTKH